MNRCVKRFLALAVATVAASAVLPASSSGAAGGVRIEANFLPGLFLDQSHEQAVVNEVPDLRSPEWYLQDRPEGQFAIVNERSGKCLARPFLGGDGDAQLRDCRGDERSQAWDIVTNGYRTVAFREGEQCLTYPGAEDVPVTVTRCAGRTEQQWLLRNP